tara:strand:- start:4949 stop:6337 length:1389 start_codon:yes stop_codon:yes gene_type:complete
MDSINNYKKQWFDFTDYSPHKGQKLFHFPPGGQYDYNDNPEGVRFMVACCGRRFGKSYAAAREAEIVGTQPNKIVWIVAPNYNTSEKIFRIVYDTLVVKKGYRPSRYSAKEQILEFDWSGGKSGIYGKSAEHPSGLIGEGVDLAILDETAKIPNLRRIWEQYIRPTLSDKKGRAIMVSTPDGFGVFHELYLLGQSKKNNNWFSFNSPSWDNLYAFPKGEQDPDLIEARESLSRDTYLQEYGAEFSALSGRIYNDFSRTLNVGNYNYIPSFPTFLSIDFGYRMPAVIVAQIRPKDGQRHIYIIDEIVHERNIKIYDLCEKIKNMRYNFRACYGDPAGYQVQSSVGVGEADLFRQHTGHRIHSIRDKASRSIISGISHVRNFICNVNDDRRLHIDKKCSGIIADIESYRYPDDRENRDLKDLPLKDGVHDHGCDALRYLIVNLFPIKNFQLRKKYDTKPGLSLS